MATPNYNVNYDDKRFQTVNNEKQAALTENEKTYGNMINQSNNFYEAQIDASKEWAETQSQLQQEQTDFAIEQIEQQKEQTEKDYKKEQSGAYVDWQKQSNEYGVNAEKMAAAGLEDTGFAESSQVSMYNTYQNRVTTARETFNRAILAYDNNIKEARLQNSSILAEIAYEAQKEQLSLALEGFQYKNNLLIEQANKKLEIENMYHNKWLDVLKQINTENAMAEEMRQHNEQMAFEREQAAAEQKRWEAELAEEQRQHNEQLKEERRQFDETMSYNKSKSSGGGSGGSSGGSGKTTGGSSGKVTDSSGGNGEEETPTNNMNSIIALGYGPISASRLAQLMASGQVARTLKNGQYYYYKNTGSPSYNRLKNMGLSK